jgi:hypothetical protein
MGEVLERAYDPLHGRPLSRYAHGALCTRGSYTRTAKSYSPNGGKGGVLGSLDPRSCIAPVL